MLFATDKEHLYPTIASMYIIVHGVTGWYIGIIPGEYL